MAHELQRGAVGIGWRSGPSVPSARTGDSSRDAAAMNLEKVNGEGSWKIGDGRTFGVGIVSASDGAEERRLLS